MSLRDIIKNAVAIADTVTAPLQVAVDHYAWTGSDDFSKPTYARPVSRLAVVEELQRYRRTETGQEIVQKASITFIRPISANGASQRREPIDPRDKIVLANGYTGPILNVQGITDPGTDQPYMLEVILG